MDDESVFNPRSTVKRNGMIYGPLTLVMIFLVGVLVMSLFFRVNEIEVINASDYTDQEIVSASGIEKGVNLFFVDRFSAASMIFAMSLSPVRSAAPMPMMYIQQLTTP